MQMVYTPQDRSLTCAFGLARFCFSFRTLLAVSDGFPVPHGSEAHCANALNPYNLCYTHDTRKPQCLQYPKKNAASPAQMQSSAIPACPYTRLCSIPLCVLSPGGARPPSDCARQLHVVLSAQLHDVPVHLGAATRSRVAAAGSPGLEDPHRMCMESGRFLADSAPLRTAPLRFRSNRSVPSSSPSWSGFCCAKHTSALDNFDLLYAAPHCVSAAALRQCCTRSACCVLLSFF